MLATVYRDTTFTATKGKFTSKEEGEEAFKTIEGKPFTVTKVEKKEGKEQPPQLYDLTSLQVDCNRKFGFSAEMTLNLIQALYERSSPPIRVSIRNTCLTTSTPSVRRP